MIGFGCKHKFGQVQADKYQYCEKCGLAKNAPITGCSHKWKGIDDYSVNNVATQNVYKIIHVLQCSKCGDIKEVEIS